jgi:membrane peptidoglycan carboxypeptidase
MMRHVSEEGALLADLEGAIFPSEEVEWVIGSKWEQQFMGEENGHETLLEGAWSVNREEWLLEGWDGWQVPIPLIRCHGCHTVGLNSVTGEFVEPGIGCESCHGPARDWLKPHGEYSEGQDFSSLRALREARTTEPPERLLVEVQAAAEDAIAEVLSDPEGDPLATVMTVEPDTGAIRAMAVGPKEYGPCEEDETDCVTTQVNPAVPGLGGSGRQPGSAFKPIVLATALNEGMPRGWEEVTDSETEIEGCDDYAPRNFDPHDGGDKEMYEAIEVSNNVYHAQLIGYLQPEPVATMAQRVGIPDRDLPEHCSLALGTATVFPIDMVRAFATFANEGERCDPFPIASIEQGGEVLREHEPDCDEAINDDLALMMTDLLVTPVESGTATGAQLDRPVAGKTGITDDFRDAWFVGYVPQLATVAWVGYDEQQPMEDIHGLDVVTGGTLPTDIWVATMEAAVEDLDVEEFGDPPPQEWLEVPDAVGDDIDDLLDGLEDYDFHIDVEEDVHPRVGV